MGGILGDGPSWLGSAYAPFDTAGNARNNMNLQITMDRLAERRSLMRSLDTVSREIDRSGLMQGFGDQTLSSNLCACYSSADIAAIYGASVTCQHFAGGGGATIVKSCP